MHLYPPPYKLWVVPAVPPGHRFTEPSFWAYGFQYTSSLASKLARQYTRVTSLFGSSVADFVVDRPARFYERSRFGG